MSFFPRERNKLELFSESDLRFLGLERNNNILSHPQYPEVLFYELENALAEVERPHKLGGGKENRLGVILLALSKNGFLKKGTQVWLGQAQKSMVPYYIIVLPVSDRLPCGAHIAVSNYKFTATFISKKPFPLTEWASFHTSEILKRRVIRVIPKAKEDWGMRICDTLSGILPLTEQRVFLWCLEHLQKYGVFPEVNNRPIDQWSRKTWQDLNGYLKEGQQYGLLGGSSIRKVILEGLQAEIERVKSYKILPQDIHKLNLQTLPTLSWASVASALPKLNNQGISLEGLIRIGFDPSKDIKKQAPHLRMAM